MPDHPHLAQLSDHVLSSKRRLESIAEEPETALRLKPGPKSWSVCEVAEHVRITNAAYLNALAPAFKTAEKSQADADFRPGLFARLFIGLVSPDPKFKVRTVSSAFPEDGTTDRDALDKLIAQQDALIDALNSADDVNLNKTKVTSPLSSLVRFTIGEALTVLVMHQLRHLQQMDRALKAAHASD